MPSDILSEPLEKLQQVGLTAPLRILFVCKGNYFRSPTLEAILNFELANVEWGAMVLVRSAGIWAPESMGPYCNTDLQKELKAQGVTESLKNPRALVKTELLTSHIVFVSDSTVARAVKKIIGADNEESPPFCLPFASLAPSRYGSSLDMPDPYYGDCTIKEMVENALQTIKAQLLPSIKKTILKLDSKFKIF